jgi:hypothetical protein
VQNILENIFSELQIIPEYVTSYSESRGVLKYTLQDELGTNAELIVDMITGTYKYTCNGDVMYANIVIL